MLWFWRRVLYREPFDAPLPLINVGVGCFSVLVGLIGIYLKGPGLLIGPVILAQGLMFVCLGVSDLLPPTRGSTILALRVGFLVFQSAVFVLIFAVLLRGLGF